MIINIDSIDVITNNGEFTTIELLSGDVIHTPTIYERVKASITFVEYTIKNGEQRTGLSIDILPID